MTSMVHSPTPGNTDEPTAGQITEVEQVISEWMRRGVTTMKNVVAMMMRKGGAGKTTKTLLIADALSRFGLNVLVIDMDPQGNASLASADRSGWSPSRRASERPSWKSRMSLP